MAEKSERGFPFPPGQLPWHWEQTPTGSDKKMQSPFRLFHSLRVPFPNPSKKWSNLFRFEREESAAAESDGAEFQLSGLRNAPLRSIVRKNRFRGLNFSSPQELGSSFLHMVHAMQSHAIQNPIDHLGSKFAHWRESLLSIRSLRDRSTHPLEGILNAIGNRLNHLYHERSSLPLLASISSSASKPLPPNTIQEAQKAKTMTPAQISKRLDGVPVYAVSNYSNEFVLVSDINSNKSLGIFCFRQEDAEALLAQVKDREPSLGRGARVVSVSLDKVYQLNAEGIAFRFLPDPRQVRHALEETKKLGDSGKGFDGVPVFLSDNLILKVRSQRLCPIFFSKEDLENALQKAISQQQRTNPNLRVKNEIQVGSFEDVLKKMESNEEESEWGNIVFIPLGMDAKNFLERSVTNAKGN